jgi:hypothetical protein
MLDMANKKNKYQYATIKGGRALPVDKLKTGETGGVSEVGVWVEGKAPEGEKGREEYRELRITAKSNAKLTGRDRSKKQTLPLAKMGEVSIVKEVYPQNTGRVLSYIQYIVQYKAPHKKGVWQIKNIAEASRFMEMQPHRFKESIANLMKAYPYITARGGNIVDKQYRQIVDIEVRLRTKNPVEKGKGFITEKEEEILDKESVIDTIFIEPSKEFLNGLGLDSYGKQLSKQQFSKRGGLGNVLLPISSLKDSKNESLMEYKVRNFLISNKPVAQIGVDKILTHLGITEEDLAKQGRPRYKRQIDSVMERLKDRGILERWSYSKTKDMYYTKTTREAHNHPAFYKRLKQG